MNQYLVVSAIGEDRPGIVSELSKTIVDLGGNIADSRMTVLGGEFALILLISGSWDVISKMEESIPGLQESLRLTIITKRTDPSAAKARGVPYLVDVVAMDHPGIVSKVAGFLSTRGINIQDMDTQSYAAAHTGTPMFSLTMTVSVPAEQSISELRDEFTAFCDELNLDAVLEPTKD